MTWSLRSLAANDVDWIFNACQDEEIQRWTMVPRPYLRENAIQFTRDLAGDVAVWVIEQKQKLRPSGVIGIHSISEGDGVADIGYWLAPWARGHGAMSEALKILKIELMTWPSVRVIKATIAEENFPSRRTVEKAGFSLSGPAENLCRCDENEVKALDYYLTPSKL